VPRRAKGEEERKEEEWRTKESRFSKRDTCCELSLIKKLLGISS